MPCPLPPVVDVVWWTIINKDYSDKRDQIVVLKKTLQSTESAMVVSKTYPGAEELIAKFNQALRAVKESGVYDGIPSRYGLAR